MKHVYAVLLLLFALCDLTRAQFIAENHATTAGNDVPGNANESLVCPLANAPAAPWQKAADQVFGHIRGSRLAKLKNTSADIISLFHDSVLTEASLNPIWHGEYFSAGNGAPQTRFGVSCVFRNGDANTTAENDLTIFANDISPLVGHLTVNGQEFVTLKGFIPGLGNPAFEFDMPASADDAGNSQETMHVKAWLVTADSTMLPYIPVTRKEYLEAARQQLERHREAIIADIHRSIQVRSTGEQAAEKKQALDQLSSTYSGIELQTRIKIYLSSYKTDEEYMAKNIAAATEDLDRTLALIARLRTGSTAKQLAQPAIVSVPASAFLGFEDGQPNSTVLVRLRGAYYTGDTDQPTIKSLLICWRYHPADQKAAGIDRQLAASFNEGPFRSLLDK